MKFNQRQCIPAHVQPSSLGNAIQIFKYCFILDHWIHHSFVDDGCKDGPTPGSAILNYIHGCSEEGTSGGLAKFAFGI